MTKFDLDTSKSLCKSTFDHWRKAGKTDTNSVITQNLPSRLISIEELVSPDEDITLPENQPTLEIKERESIFYSPFRSDTWYVSLKNFLENSGLSFSPP